jgi:hypothetical protein
MLPQREFLIERLSQARGRPDQLVRQAATDKNIIPNSTIKEYFYHIAGWDDATSEALREHAQGQPIPQPPAGGINAYDAQPGLMV